VILFEDAEIASVRYFGVSCVDHLLLIIVQTPALRSAERSRHEKAKL
jgi:hypothetical protein